MNNDAYSLRQSYNIGKKVSPKSKLKLAQDT